MKLRINKSITGKYLIDFEFTNIKKAVVLEAVSAASFNVTPSYYEVDDDEMLNLRDLFQLIEDEKNKSSELKNLKHQLVTINRRIETLESEKKDKS